LIVVALAFLVGMAVRTSLNDDVEELMEKGEKLMDVAEHSVMGEAATEKAEEMKQCAKDISQPSPVNDIKSHFDSKREAMKILSVDATAETCTKRDVCLLMRQLDMDFYKRARAGKLTDADYTMTPEIVWFSANTCKDNNRGEGKRWVPVMDMKACETQAQALLKKESITSTKNIQQEPFDEEHPAGCSIVIKNKKKAIVFLNTDSNSTAPAGIRLNWSPEGGNRDKDTRVLCEHDRALSDSAATFYSPYKLKKSMAASDMAKMSTTCSFGKYADLANAGKTQSSCANILTFRTDPKYHSAEDALKAGEKEYVKKVKAKYVLMSIIANDWCPSVWKEALLSPQVCLVPRVMDEAAEEDKTLMKLFEHPRADKIAFVDDFCEGVKDETLASMLDKEPDAPPDFFADAKVA